MKRILPPVLSFLLAAAAPLSSPRATPPSVLSDTLYAGLHPTLLFREADLPALYTKVRDGGEDDLAYLFIRNRVDNVYAYLSLVDLLENDYGLEQIPNLGLATFLESPYDTVARDLGRDLTLYIADAYVVDDDPYASSLRLRNLALGYDLFFDNATVAERQRIVDEATEYITYMLSSGSYASWHFRPYVSNQTAMVAAALGLASIGLRYELETSLANAALTAADDYFQDWMDAHLEQGGAYREGLLYGLWSMRHLVYYFHARELYDGTDYSLLSGVRKMEEWIAYELDPRGQGRVNNLNDCTDFFRPLSRHNTYYDWAQSKWGSELSAYIFLHGPGGFGVDMGDNADKAATAMWWQPLSIADPGALLPPAHLWTSRGLYCYRTGWPLLFNSDDLVFSFYSGAFHGGHAQEDQNQFTLTAYGEKLVTDHGAGHTAKQSEAHGVVLIDGAGQHNAGYSIGTDGDIASYLLGDYMDYLVGDATAAYTTYSPYNQNGYPFPTSDWSWGHTGANPVDFALRKVVVVHEAETPPFFIIRDDIQKDGGVHTYEWRLHTAEENTIVTGDNPVHVVGDQGAMEVLVVQPCIDSLAVSKSYFDNLSDDDNSDLLSLTVDAVNPRFTTILLPRPAAATAPTATVTALSGGTVTTLDWGNGYTDMVWVAGADTCNADTSGAPMVSLVTDAEMAVVRTLGASLVRYLMTNGTTLWFGGVEQVSVTDGPTSVTKSDALVFIDRLDADFLVYSPQDAGVYYHEIPVPTVRQGQYLLSAATSAVGPTAAVPRPLGVRAFPNPFNPTVTVVLDVPASIEVTADVFDVGGRRVARLWSGILPPGEKSLSWNAGPASSGVYFLRVATPLGTQSVKLTVVK